jgi:hypothetical protein
MDIITARQVAARIWCDQDYSHVVMNPELAEQIAWLLMEEANHHPSKRVIAVDIAGQSGTDELPA